MPIIQQGRFGRIHFSLFIFVLFLLPVDLHGQRKCVILDKNTFEPVAHASLYYKENRKLSSTITDINGHATINFAFKQLTISHLNYEKSILKSLTDTIFLTPKSYMTGEITIKAQEPAWIRPLLKKFVKTKRTKYFNKRSIYICT